MIKLGIANEEDRISQLPEALILQILSLLPTKDVIATTALSKQWKFRWKMVPKLMFNSYDHGQELGKFAKNVCKSLLSHKAPVLESLHLQDDTKKITAVDIGVLLGIAFGRNVRELLLDVGIYSFIFPAILYTSETLETLILRFCVLVDVPSQMCLIKSLKTLHLDYVKYKDDASVLDLLSGFPCLETLVVKRFPEDGIMNTFTIAVPSLQSLSIYDEPHEEKEDGEHRRYVINAPNLKYLHIDVVSCFKIFLIENSPEMLRADIFCESVGDKFLGSLTSVKILTLLLHSPLEVTYPTGKIFYRLAHLELYTSKPAWWNLLTLMLDTCPKLKVLELLIDHWQTVKEDVVCEKWNQPKNVPECLLFHLKTFMWAGYKGEREEEREVAKYILKNASRLETATFVHRKSSWEDGFVIERLKELKSHVVRDSTSCKLEFKTFKET